MFLSPPKFWNKPGSVLSYILEPFSWFYRIGTVIHNRISKPYQASVPVISIGNIILGGAGKTPVTIAIAKTLISMGYTPHIISRGYGGVLKGPLQVNLEHQYSQVGDEPLLLAKYAPTWISKNRKAAVKLAIKSGADVLLLDDAHQNYTLKKDLCFVVVNGSNGFGNGRVFPAGPLRQSIQSGLKEATTIVFISQDNDPVPPALRSISCPVIQARIIPISPKPCAVMGFAGIGYPEKFRQTLEQAGYEVKIFKSFPDHYPYTEDDLRKLRMRARVEKVFLITTEKDAMRIPHNCRNNILILPMDLAFEPASSLETELKKMHTRIES
ncbi:MAG: tetraacyldisaccharide 4'-kinase [Alphaproteobacteria bacterium]|nr:tetraacyldisaccharide 4'-kinase [Alphaproteobacteria bacterium]